MKLAMGVSRSLLLAASTSEWMRARAARYGFVRRTMARFMPGEALEDALEAADTLRRKNIGAVLTHLGENVKDADEARKVSAHYAGVLEKMLQRGMHAEVSVKLTQMGLDISPGLCFENLLGILKYAPERSTIWIDMEASRYVDATLDIYRGAVRDYPNAAICLQAYLHRTAEDVAGLRELRPSIRLVKGAYMETSAVAFPDKRDVDENFFNIAVEMLRAKAEGRLGRAAFGTHDLNLIRRITEQAAAAGVPRSDVEVHMLYGIQRREQERLASEGWGSIVLIAHGQFWFQWFMRRLAERPANAWFLVRNLFSGN